MIFPDKLVVFQDSILAKSIHILKELEEHRMSASDLFIAVKAHYEDISEFMLALDVLYILNKIQFNEDWEVMEYVRRNKM